MKKVFSSAWVGAAMLLAALGAQARPAPAVALTGPAVPSCSWDSPGHNPFMGDVVAAVDRYPDIPSEVRERLKARMAKRQYDEVVSIRRDSIEGRHSYKPDITGMHFGLNQVCRTVTRAKWTESMQERGLVYCEGGHCILVPTVCRNVSRITRQQPTLVSPMAATAPEEVGPLDFAAPAAGPLGPLGEDPVGGGAGSPGVAGLLPGAGGAPRTFAQGLGPSGGGGSTPSNGPVFPVGPSDEDDGGGGNGGHGGNDGDPPVRPPRPPVLPPVLPPVPPSPPPVTPVPEPGTWLLMAAGLVGVVAGTRRRAAARAAR